jgi:hypothetical protein
MSCILVNNEYQGMITDLVRPAIDNEYRGMITDLVRHVIHSFYIFVLNCGIIQLSKMGK